LQANLDIKESEHAIQTLGKERTAAMNSVTNLEKQYEWILQDKELGESILSCASGVLILV
jgi:hypothetical protein